MPPGACGSGTSRAESGCTPWAPRRPTTAPWPSTTPASAAALVAAAAEAGGTAPRQLAPAQAQRLQVSGPAPRRQPRAQRQHAAEQQTAQAPQHRQRQAAAEQQRQRQAGIAGHPNRRYRRFSGSVSNSLPQAAKGIAAGPAMLLLMLTGQGKSFCAGGDLNWMQDQMAGDAEMRRAAAGSIASMLGAINTLPQPVIGRVQGNAFGGGVGVISVCDVAVGADSVKLGLTETRLGLIPATIGPYVWARLGVARARAWAGATSIPIRLASASASRAPNVAAWLRWRSHTE